MASGNSGSWWTDLPETGCCLSWNRVCRSPEIRGWNPEEKLNRTSEGARANGNPWVKNETFRNKVDPRKWSLTTSWSVTMVACRTEALCFRTAHTPGPELGEAERWELEAAGPAGQASSQEIQLWAYSGAYFDLQSITNDLQSCLPFSFQIRCKLLLWETLTWTLWGMELGNVVPD